jgi:hypothetical protein
MLGMIFNVIRPMKEWEAQVFNVIKVLEMNADSVGNQMDPKFQNLVR